MDLREWQDVLFPQYRWMIGYTNIGEMMKEFITRMSLYHGESFESVYQSNIWAVAMAYMDFKYYDYMLSYQEHLYARNRDGIMGQNGGTGEYITLREYLESHDGAFAQFSRNTQSIRFHCESHLKKAMEP